MAATFGSPVSAVLLAVELLLFEYRPRSLIPVAIAAAVAAGVRALFQGTQPVFGMPPVAQPGMVVGVGAHAQVPGRRPQQAAAPPERIALQSSGLIRSTFTGSSSVSPSERSSGRVTVS